MIKNLRYLLLSLLTIMSTATFAQKTVTIDFDNDYQALFPSLAGVSSSDSQDGDFTGVTNSTLVDGVVMVAIDPDAEASTPSRIWTSSPRLRMYSGSFTVISLGLPITKIEFNAHSKNFNLTAVNGTLDERVWTGSSNGPIFMVTKNTQISSIVVTLGEGGDTPDNPDLPISNDLLSKFTFNSGSFTDKDNQMVFDFAGVAVYNEQNVDLTGNFVFDLDENQICTKTTVNLTFPSVVLAQLAYLDTQANSEDYESVLLSGSTLTAVIKDGFNGYSKLVIKSMLKIILDNEQGGLGILESPMSPNQANVIAGTLEKDRRAKRITTSRVRSLRSSMSSALSMVLPHSLSLLMVRMTSPSSATLSTIWRTSLGLMATRRLRLVMKSSSVERWSTTMATHLKQRRRRLTSTR